MGGGSYWAKALAQASREEDQGYEEAALEEAHGSYGRGGPRL